MKKRPAFNYSSCIACGICFSACPVSCIELSAVGALGGSEAFPELARPDSCLSCGLCERSCPMDAITLKEAEA